MTFMSKNFKYNVAIFFTVFFMAIIAAPSIIVSLDDSIDVASFYSLNEEEESEEFKLVLDNSDKSFESHVIDVNSEMFFEYSPLRYPKPHLNLVLPPPEITIL